MAFVFELGHSVQFAEGRDTVQNPRPFGVLSHMSLNEQGRTAGINAPRHQQHPGTSAAFRECRGLEWHRHRVKVDHAIQRFMVFLEGNPVLDRAERIAEVHLVCGLDSRKDPFHGD